MGSDQPLARTVLESDVCCAVLSAAGQLQRRSTVSTVRKKSADSGEPQIRKRSGDSSSAYLRNAVLPDLHLHLQWIGSSALLGIGGEYKRIKPQTSSSRGYQVRETLSSSAVIGYGKFHWKSLEVRAQGIYGENLTDVLMLGGYAVSEKNPISGALSFTNISTAAGWIDLTAGRTIRGGIFLGYTRNLGSEKEISGSYFSRGADIHWIYRIAPRLRIGSGNTQFALELEHTAAAYGTPDSYGVVEQELDVSNTRLIFATFFHF